MFKLSRIVRAVHLSVALNQSVRVVSVLKRVFPLLNLAISIYIVAFLFFFHNSILLEVVLRSTKTDVDFCCKYPIRDPLNKKVFLEHACTVCP